MLNGCVIMPDGTSQTSTLPQKKIWDREYQNKLPSSVTIYGTNSDPNDQSAWVKLGNYEEAPMDRMKTVGAVIVQLMRE